MGFIFMVICLPLVSELPRSLKVSGLEKKQIQVL